MRMRIIGAVTAAVLAVAGAIVVVLYVRGADDRAFQDSRLMAVYVVDETVPVGTPGEEMDEFVTVQRYPARTVQAGRIVDLSELEGLVTAAELLPGDQLIEDRFIDPQLLAIRGEVAVPEGLQEVTVSLPIERIAGGAATPGSHVGVLVSNGTQDALTTQFILQKVLVTRIVPGDAYLPDGADAQSAPVSRMLVTVALATADIEKVVWAAEQESLWMTLQPESADVSGSRPVNRDNIFR